MLTTRILGSLAAVTLLACIIACAGGRKLESAAATQSPVATGSQAIASTSLSTRPPPPAATPAQQNYFPQPAPQPQPVPSSNPSDAEIQLLYEAKLKLAKEAFAEAEADYKTALLRHVEDVAEHSRRLADHDEKMKKHESDLADYPAKVKKYETDASLYEAELALQSAQRIAEPLRKALVSAKNAGNTFEAQRLIERLEDRYAAVIRKYPNTPAATAALALKRGEEFPERPSPVKPEEPTRPTKPTPPVEPTKPSAPSPPSEQAIFQTAKREYADAIAKEEERSRKLKEEAEAAARRKAEEEYDADGLVLLNDTLKGKVGTIGIEITGTVVNRRPRTLRYAQIKFALYDKTGAQVGTALANINGLESGNRWNFKALGFEKAAKFKVSELSGF